MLIVVRHGNTFEAGEAPRRIGARTDLPLTASGQAQAAALGAHFAERGWRFARVLVSPLRRTRQTAAAILAAQPAAPEPETAPFLREIDHGPDENCTEDKVQARIGAAALAEWDAAATPPPGWSVDAEARIAAWADLLRELKAGQAPTLLVTSNGAARFALLAAPELHAPTLKLPTGSFGIIQRGADGALSVPVWGQRP